MPLLDPEFVTSCLRQAMEREGAPDDPDLPEEAAAVAVVVHMSGAGPAMLWIQRADNPNDPWSGHMGFPGGRPEPQDDGSCRATAERETLEELGLDLKQHADHLGKLREQLVYNRTGEAPFRLVAHLYWTDSLPELVPQASEVAAVHSIDLAYLLDSRYATSQEVTWQKRRFRFPAIRYQQMVIWGLSHRIWLDLRARLGDTELAEHLPLDPTADHAENSSVEEMESPEGT